MQTLKIIILVLAAFGLASLFTPLMAGIYAAGQWIIIPLTLAAGAALLYTTLEALRIWRQVRPGRSVW